MGRPGYSIQGFSLYRPHTFILQAAFDFEAEVGTITLARDSLELPVRHAGLVVAIPTQACRVHNCSLQLLRSPQGFSALNDTVGNLHSRNNSGSFTHALEPLPTGS